jgi:hypothetical protein
MTKQHGCGMSPCCAANPIDGYVLTAIRPSEAGFWPAQIEMDRQGNLDPLSVKTRRRELSSDLYLVSAGLFAFQAVAVPSNGHQELRIAWIVLDFLSQKPNITTECAPSPLSILSPNLADECLP